MDFYSIVRTRRSVREYADTPIPEDVLQRVLDAARVAPSGSNRQPTRLIVVRDADQRRALVPMCAGQKFIAKAPVVIIGVGKTISFNRGNYMGDFAVLMDVTMAMDHLILAARSEGLGTCWIGAFDNGTLKSHLHIPDGWNVVALTPLGYPAGDLFTEVTDRIPLGEFLMQGRWRETPSG